MFQEWGQGNFFVSRLVIGIDVSALEGPLVLYSVAFLHYVCEEGHGVAVRVKATESRANARFEVLVQNVLWTVKTRQHVLFNTHSPHMGGATTRTCTKVFKFKDKQVIKGQRFGI